MLLQAGYRSISSCSFGKRPVCGVDGLQPRRGRTHCVTIPLPLVRGRETSGVRTSVGWSPSLTRSIPPPCRANALGCRGFILEDINCIKSAGDPGKSAIILPDSQSMLLTKGVRTMSRSIKALDKAQTPIERKPGVSSGLLPFLNL